MSTEARCEKCNKMLGKLEGLDSFLTLVQACRADADKLVFSVQCPRCKKLNRIKMMHSE